VSSLTFSIIISGSIRARLGLPGSLIPQFLALCRARLRNNSAATGRLRSASAFASNLLKFEATRDVSPRINQIRSASPPAAPHRLLETRVKKPPFTRRLSYINSSIGPWSMPTGATPPLHSLTRLGVESVFGLFANDLLWRYAEGSAGIVAPVHGAAQCTVGRVPCAKQGPF
jgi:hypothetical protein